LLSKTRQDLPTLLVLRIKVASRRIALYAKKMMNSLVFALAAQVIAFPPMNQSSVPGYGRASTPIPAQAIGRGISNWPTRLVATYTYTSPWTSFDFKDAINNGGSKFFVLAFLLSDSNGNPAWGGSDSISNPWYSNYIGNIRAAGGDVIISFGGAAGKFASLTLGDEIALRNSDVNKLAAAYQSVINRYAITFMDVDIEGSSLHNVAANNRRYDAFNILLRNNPNLKISITIAVSPQGFDYHGKLLIDGAAARNVKLYMVNLM
jgi:hypothetical protein